MPIVTLIKLFLSLASSLAQYAHDKQMLDAGAAQSVLKGIEDANTAIASANDARAHADSVPVSKDPNNRDNK
jgi:hypothetical protein